MAVNVVDLVAGVVILGAAFFGYRTGAVVQLGGLAGAIIGLALVFSAMPTLNERLVDADPTVHLVVVVGALILGFGLGQGIGSILGSHVATGREKGVLGHANRALGVLVGVLEALFVLWLVGSLIAVGPDAKLAALVRQSATVRALSSVAPPPEVVAESLQRSLSAAGISELFEGLAPAPAAPAQLPSEKKARALAAKAEPSTVKVITSACGKQKSGSGAVIGNHYAVTNAHVVAGAETVQIVAAGHRVEATPVRFDSNLDVALLYAPELDAPSLRFSPDDPSRGDRGVALGYPGGGSLVAVPASVNQGIRAQGVDMYGKSRATRDVLELHAEINSGDSGGPLVLQSGMIGGVIFAKSQTEKAIGYALTPTSVANVVMPSVGATAPVATGRCVG